MEWVIMSNTVIVKVLTLLKLLLSSSYFFTKINKIRHPEIFL